MQREILVTAICRGDSYPLKLIWTDDRYLVMCPTDKKGFWKLADKYGSFKSYCDFEKYMNDLGYYVKEKVNAKKNITD